MMNSFKIIPLIMPLLLGFTCSMKQSPSEGHKPIKFEARLAEINPKEGLVETIDQSSGLKIYLHKEAVITNEDIAGASVAENDFLGGFQINIIFTEEGANKMKKVTEENIGKMLAILFDGQVISAPSVQNRITDKAQITGNFTKEEAERIANGIKSK